MRRHLLCYHAVGFTLIEIIVSVAIVLLISGILVANYNGFHDTQQVRQAASTVIDDLQAVRTQAAAGVKPEGCDTLVGYRVTFPSETTYKSVALCLVGGVQQTVGAATTYTLPSGTTFSPIPQSDIFYALDRGASLGQTVTITGNGGTVKISILSSGVMSNFVPTPTP